MLAEPRLIVSPGVRLDIDTQFGTHPSPRLAARFDPTKAVTVRGAYGWGLRAPSFQELYLRFENPAVGYVVDGNTALKPERSRGYNLAADFRVTEGATLSASLFLTDLYDLVDIVTLQDADAENPTRFSYGNVSRARTSGAELGARLKLSAGTYLDVGYTLLEAYNFEKNRPLEGRPQHRATAQVQGRIRKIALDWVVRGALVGRRTFFIDTNLDGEADLFRTRPYADLEVQLTWYLYPLFDGPLFTDGAVFAGAQNLFNSADTNFLIRPPRSFQAGLLLNY